MKARFHRWLRPRQSMESLVSSAFWQVLTGTSPISFVGLFSVLDMQDLYLLCRQRQVCSKPRTNGSVDGNLCCSIIDTSVACGSVVPPSALNPIGPFCYRAISGSGNQSIQGWPNQWTDYLEGCGYRDSLL